MGKASSGKKVARAAGLGGGRAYGARPPWAYYFAVFALLLLGVIGVYNSREYLDAKTAAPASQAPTIGTTWWEGLAVDACGKLLPAINSTKDPDGITTRGGIIYIEPKTKSVSGHNATLWTLENAVGLLLNAGELEVPGGHLYVNGDSCDGKAGHVYVMTWSNPSSPPQDGVLQDKKSISQSTGLEDTCNPDCDSGVLLENDQLVTVAFLPVPPKGKTPSFLQPPGSVVSKLATIVDTNGTTTTVATTAPTVPVRTSTTLKGTTSTTAAKTTTDTTSKTTTTTAKAKKKK